MTYACDDCGDAYEHYGRGCAGKYCYQCRMERWLARVLKQAVREKPPAYGEQRCIDCGGPFIAGHRAQRCFQCSAADRHRRAQLPENQLKERARRETAAAIRRGVLVRQPCEVCGDNRVHAHHVDYHDPLNIKWLCPLHHSAEHDRLNRMRRAA